MDVITDWDKWMTDHHIKLKGSGDPHDNSTNEECNSGRLRRTKMENPVPVRNV